MPPHTTTRRGPHHRAAWLIPATALLLATTLLSLILGAKPLDLTQVTNGLTDPASSDYTVVHDLRLPRTLLGLLAGAALGLAGAIMQALTRNPLADPGILGINAGAAAAVVTATTFLPITAFTGYIWFAFAGAATIAVVVYAVGGGRNATPARLALAGAAITAVLFSYIQAIQILHTETLATMRFWTVGSLASAQNDTIPLLLPFIAAGITLALTIAPALNALALGDATATSLGAHPTRVRTLAIIAVTLLAGAATAACGPIVFIGLAVPHLVRAITGPDLRWILPYSAFLAPALLLIADITGRILARPSELQVGIMTAVLGGPFFLYFIRQRKAVPA